MSRALLRVLNLAFRINPDDSESASRGRVSMLGGMSRSIIRKEAAALKVRTFKAAAFPLGRLGSRALQH